MSDSAAWVNVGLTAIAAIVSIWAILAARSANKRSNDTQERLVKIEESREQDKKKARLVAQIVNEVVGQKAHQTIKKHLLQIENKGLAEARDIQLILDEKPVLEHPAIVKDQKEIIQIGPQSHFDYLIVYCSNTPRPEKVEITWMDDSGEPGRYQTSLT